MITSAEEGSYHLTRMVCAFHDDDEDMVALELEILAETVGDAIRLLCVMATTVGEQLVAMIPPSLMDEPDSYPAMTITTGDGQFDTSPPAVWATRLVSSVMSDRFHVTHLIASMIVNQHDEGDLFFGVFRILLPKLAEVAFEEIRTIKFQQLN